VPLLLPTSTSGFGNSVAVVGDTLVVGSEEGDAVYVFSRKTWGAWEYMQDLHALDGTKNNYFSAMWIRGLSTPLPVN